MWLITLNHYYYKVSALFSCEYFICVICVICYDTCKLLGKTCSARILQIGNSGNGNQKRKVGNRKQK